MEKNLNTDVSTNSYEEVVEDICKVLRDSGLSIRQSLDVLKTVKQDIVLHMPITDTLDSCIK